VFCILSGGYKVFSKRGRIVGSAKQKIRCKIRKNK